REACRHKSGARRSDPLQKSEPDLTRNRDRHGKGLLAPRICSFTGITPANKVGAAPASFTTAGRPPIVACTA
ncbi:MAG: hypothetical protein ABUS49_13110, partial [Acidobacteriota bacterium]